MIDLERQVLDEGNCGRATCGGEEACDRVRERRVCLSPPGHDLVKAARLRTETPYKAGVVRRAGHFVKSRATINVSPKSLQRFKHRVKEITGRSRGISMEQRLGELQRYVRGWMGYFGVASQLKLFAQLDGWIRRRIRCCYWKQWRRPKTRRRKLIALGVPRRQAIRHARSRKGPWHLAKSIATGVGLNNAYLAEQGVLSMKTLWAELAHLRRTA